MLSLRNRSLVAVAAAALLVTPLAVSGAEAQSRTKPRKAKPAPQRVYDDNSRWYPNNADKLKIGSRIWWDQMQREGRIGGGGGDFNR